MKILLADDHHVVREALAGFLTRASREITVVEAWTVEHVLEKIATHDRFDLVVLDFNMPGMNGLAGLETVRQAVGDVPVAILSGHITPDQVMAALDRGAGGVVTKDVRGTALLSALRLIAAGETFVPTGILSGLTTRNADRPQKEATNRTALGGITHRELQCVEKLVQGQTNREIAEHLHLSEVTIKLHLHSAFRKMGARNRADAVRIAMLKGIDGS